MTLIYLVRHGEPDYEPIDSRGWPGLSAGLATLTPVGIKQAQAVADELSGVGANYLVTSPYTRAIQSASVIGHRLALGVRVDFDFGDWLPDTAGSWRGPADVRAAAAELTEFDGEWPDGVPRNWEPLSRVRERARAAMRRCTTITDGPILVITHNRVIQAITGEANTPHGGHHRLWFDPDA
ncbi:histidine phosphatase family protein [Kribbella sp. NBC_01245]|uniref:histidine phosphatase family protein n=1 Tax=Kribbella sp. NBC_01245 TaxID=2903578 RepID=UPI002E2B739B|nr:histidine phosphatase family protein [Kribbella sp. NBC_01245]